MPENNPFAPRSAEEKPKPAEEKKPRTGTGLASRGKPVSTDDYPMKPFPQWNPVNDEEIDQLTDFSDLSEVNQRLNRLRARFYRIHQALAEAQRAHSEAKSEYSKRLRREMVNISGGTEKTRVAMAEIACEEWESEVTIRNQVVNELVSEQRIISKDLDILETLSNNIRAQMKVM